VPVLVAEGNGGGNGVDFGPRYLPRYLSPATMVRGNGGNGGNGGKAWPPSNLRCICIRESIRKGLIGIKGHPISAPCRCRYRDASNCPIWSHGAISTRVPLPPLPRYLLSFAEYGE
jgi:hypothetical protein